MIINGKKYLTSKEVAQMIGRSVSDVNYHCKVGNLERIKYCKRLYVTKESVDNFLNKIKKDNLTYSAYDDIVLDEDESVKFLDSYHNPNALSKPLKYSSKTKYAISNKGRIFNLTLDHEFSQSVSTHGYLQCCLSLKEKKYERVHVLVAYAWCPNAKRKSQVHHIDGNKVNNVPENLIWLTSVQHKKAHTLLAAAIETGNHEEYNTFILEMKEENSYDNEYRCIAFEKDNCIIFSWITKDAYSDYKSGKRTLNEIFYYENLGDNVVRKEAL